MEQQNRTLESMNLIELVNKEADYYGVLKHFQNTLLNTYQPDINGYTLLFMIPPDLSGLKIPQAKLSGDRKLEAMYEPGQIESTLTNAAKFITFAAVDYSPPQEQLNTEKISGRTGGVPYATELTMSEQFSATYIDDSNLTIYSLHQLWLYYIWDLVEGKISPNADKYLNPAKMDSYEYGALDYTASFYIVKYLPDLQTIRYVGKCIGAFPQGLPSKELIGQRTGNELTTLPMQYFVSSYRSQVVGPNSNDWLINELKTHVLDRFKTLDQYAYNYTSDGSSSQTA